ncbi:hypothetical protein Tco_0425147 [Tanacetum coccineum]
MSHTLFHMAQQVSPAAQLVLRFQTIRRCNNYAVLQSIIRSPECKVVGRILLDHPLSYALAATVDVHVVYLQQFCRTVSKVPGPEETIKFMLNTQEFIYIVDMFRDILHFPVETLENPFVTPVNIETIEAFLNRVFNRCLTTRTSRHDQTKINILQMFHVVINRINVDYAALLWWDFMNHLRQKKEALQYPRFIKLILADLMKKFPKIPQRIEEDYHSIKDDIPLEIHATDDFKEYETVCMNVDVPMNLSQLVVSIQGTHRQQKVVKGEKDDDDSENRLEPGSHKDNPERVNDDDDKDVEKVDEEKGVLHQGVSQLAKKATEDLIENNLKSCIAATIIEDRNAFRSEVQDLVSQDFNAQAPMIIEELFKNYVQSNVIQVHPTITTDDDIHSHHYDHQEDDAPPEGEKRVKRQKASKSSKSARGSLSKHSAKDSTTYVSKQQQQQQEWDAWVEEIVIDEDEVIPER